MEPRCEVARVRRPLPVPDLGHIRKMPADVVVKFIEFFAQHLDCIRSLHAKPRKVFQWIAQGENGSFR
jgi:hypothetical protein